MKQWDAVVVGAGPAGLTAAAYLGRFRRSVLVLHDDKSRARWIPTSHNTPGFPAGVSGPDYLKRLEAQAVQYGATIHAEQVVSIEFTLRGFAVSTGQQTYHARFLILATGVVDKLPPLDGVEQAVQRSIVRICPICDAYEAIDQAIAVLGDGLHGVREAEFLTTYSDRVSLIHVGPDLSDGDRERLTTGGISLYRQRLADVSIEESGVFLQSGSSKLRFDVCYTALGCRPQTALLQNLNAQRDESGALIVNAHQETSVRGVYAAGDVVRGLNQLIVASAEAALAATNIHNKLRADL